MNKTPREKRILLFRSGSLKASRKESIT